MNSNVKNVLIFLTGAATGALSTWLLVKKYYEFRSDLEIDEVRKVYAKQIDEIKGSGNSLDGSIEGPEEIKEVEPEPGVSRTTSSIARELNNKPPLTDYASMFHGKGQKLENIQETLRDATETAKSEAIDPSEAIIEQDLAELESPPEDEEMSDEEDEEEQDMYTAQMLNKIHQSALREHRKPIEITADKYYELLNSEGYNEVILNWFMFDDELRDLADGDVDEELFVGDLITTTGFDSNDLDKLYVRNDVLMDVVLVNKIYREFGF